MLTSATVNRAAGCNLRGIVSKQLPLGSESERMPSEGVQVLKNAVKIFS
jgi:hypothetical protein